VTSFSRLDLEREIAVALPSAAASTLAPVLDALTVADLPPLAAVHATVLLPASHAGRAGIDALSRQSVGLLNFQPALDPEPFPAILAFNAVAPSQEATVLFEARTEGELRALVPALGHIPIALQPIWIGAFSGLVVSLHLSFERALGATERAAAMRLLAAHPDLGEHKREPDEPVGDEETDEPPTEALAGEEAAGEDPEALSLRDAIETEPVHLSRPLFAERSLRLVLMADPLQRTAQSVITLLQRWMAALEAN
jgi:aspartate-semialdehyde dehydrogenase